MNINRDALFRKGKALFFSPGPTPPSKNFHHSRASFIVFAEILKIFPKKPPGEEKNP